MASLFAGGLGPGGAHALYVLGLIQAVKALGLLGIAEALARGIASLSAGTGSWRSAVLLGAAAVLLRAAAAWLAQWYATRAASGAKESLRAQLIDRLIDPSDLGVGEAATLATRGLDDLDSYYRTVLPAAVGAAVIPLAVGLRILLVDPLSAIIVAATVPLIPVFMILIGQHTRQRVDAVADALSRLADHLVELACGLPVLVGLGRVEEQASALHGVSERYRTRTLATLRTAFLSALALELIATLSVALVAVTVGIRLIGGDLELEIGLLVLVLAPECYTPLREVGVAFHASQDGVAALDRVRSVIASARPAFVGGDRTGTTAGIGLNVERLVVRFAGRRRPAVDGLSVTVAPGEVVALTGPSGAGKSTVLRAIAGRLGADNATAEGRVQAPMGLAWLPQHPRTVADTVRGELALYAGDQDAAGLPALLEELGLSSVANQHPATLSPGELRRVAFARAVLRVEAGAELLLLDEPTAHLDEAAARAVERVIARLRGTVSIVLVSHDPRIIALADRVAPVDRARSSGTPVGVTSAEPLAAPDEGAASADEVLRAPPAAVPSPGSARGDGVRLLASLLWPVSGRLLAAVALGSLAALSAASLTAVSGWLIVRAAQEPAIMYLLVAIVGVRFFGLARSGLRYAERLVTHDAVFGSITVLRDRLWSAVARRGTASPALLRGGSTFDLLVITADQVRDLAPRVLLPPMVALVTAAAALVTAASLHAAVLPVFALALLVALVIAPGIALLADRQATGHVRDDQREVARRIAGVLQAADDLRGNGIDERVLADMRALDARAGAAARRSSWALGLGGAVVVAALTGLAVAVMGLCAPAVAAGDLGVEIVAVLALLPLALIDPMLAVVEAVQHVPALAGALRALAPVLEEPPMLEGPTGGDQRPGHEDALRDPVPIGTIGALRVTGLSARWPGSADPVLAGINADVGRGEWLGVTGPSGSGKSTFLSVLLRYLEPDRGTYEVDGQDVRGIDTAALRSRMAWCPQEAHLFASTIRANLLLARRAGDALSDGDLRAALREVGLGELVDTMAAGLDTQVGAGGSRLSGGERQRLAVARALLTRADAILLDEPTAHLDAETADAMVDDLRLALRDRAVVLVTHRMDDLRPGDRRVALARPLPAAR